MRVNSWKFYQWSNRWEHYWVQKHSDWQLRRNKKQSRHRSLSIETAFWLTTRRYESEMNLNLTASWSTLKDSLRTQFGFTCHFSVTICIIWSQHRINNIFWTSRLHALLWSEITECFVLRRRGSSRRLAVLFSCISRVWLIMRDIKVAS